MLTGLLVPTKRRKALKELRFGRDSETRKKSLFGRRQLDDRHNSKEKCPSIVPPFFRFSMTYCRSIDPLVKKLID